VLRQARELRACDGGQLLVLSYHQVFSDELVQVPNPNPYSVTVSQLLSHLTLLRRLGFRPVRLADVLAARRLRRALPPRSVLLTFDDGTVGQWTHADAVLRKTGFCAVTFLITGYVGAAPEFLTWNEARAMVASGRWEIGDHTHRDHHTVLSGPAMQMQSALINRIWNPLTRTLEPLPVAEARVASDLSTSLSVLRAQQLGRPLAFAYPFSRVEGPTNDAAFTEYSEELAKRMFPLRFTNYTPGRLATPADLVAGLLPRFEIHRHVDVVQMWEQLYAANLLATPPGVLTAAPRPGAVITG